MVETPLSPAQTYVCLWSHAGGEPVHIHHVIQPVSDEQVAGGVRGPFLQVEMFAARQAPDTEHVERFSDRAREMLAEL